MSVTQSRINPGLVSSSTSRLSDTSYKSDDHSASPDTSCRSNCWDINRHHSEKLSCLFVIIHTGTLTVLMALGNMAGVWNMNVWWWDIIYECPLSSMDTRGLVQPVACFSEERPVIASGRMEFHVNLSTINNEANTDVCWKWWPIRAARQR